MFVITGGGSGIGRALAKALADRGQEVFIIGRREQQLRETQTYSKNINFLCADVATKTGRDLIVSVLSKVTHIHALINNAGTLAPIARLKKISENAFNKALATNLTAPLFLTRNLYQQLQGGKVLNIGSGAAYFPIAGWSAYCISKAGLSMLTRCWQLECQEIAVASVMPGIVDTAMQAAARDGQAMDPQKTNFFKQLKAEHKLLSVETVAAFLCWLLLDVSKERFSSQEWDIYDVSHHAEWLRPPHLVTSFMDE